MTKYEMETTINFNAGEDMAEICTFEKSIILRLSRNAAATKVRDIELNGKIIGSVWNLPKKLCFPRSARTPRTLTPKHLAALKQGLLDKAKKQKSEVFNEVMKKAG